MQVLVFPLTLHANVLEMAVQKLESQNWPDGQLPHSTDFPQLS